MSAHPANTTGSNDSCKQAPGSFRPSIDRNRCEGKAECMSVCPMNVFHIGVLPLESRIELSFVGRLKARFHGWKQAFTPNADACEACGLCVRACPERAISLVAVSIVESKDLKSIK
jgi:4Fe-4S ferredoxin